MILLARLCKI